MLREPNELSASEKLRLLGSKVYTPQDAFCEGLALDAFTNDHLFIFLQVDLVAQGDSIYDIIDPADHLTVRQQLALPSALDTGELSFLSSSMQSPVCCLAPPHLPSLSATCLLISVSLHSPRSPLPLSLQHLQVPEAPECRQQTGAYSRPIPRSSTWSLLGRKPCVHSLLRSPGAETPPWPCFTLLSHVPEPSC